MRLTLRALLAYLYNVLDPSDANDFSTKVQESAVASGLVQRIGAITHKMRMNAPRIDAKGMADDANHVAEYLDNSLPEEQVGDFERACINSDMHLAEVASSYQILTMVLGKAADIPQSLKSRVYTLPLDLATTHKGSDGDPKERQRLKKTIERVAQSAKETDTGRQSVRTGSTHPVPEVPEYLRNGSRGSAAWWLSAAIIALVVAALGIRAAGKYDASNPIIGWMFSPATELADADNSSDQSDAQPTTPSQETGGDDKTSTGKDTAANDDTSDDDSAAGPKKSAGSDKADGETPSVTKVGEPTDNSADKSPGPPVPPVEPEPAATSEVGSDAKGTTKSGDKTAAAPAADAAKPAAPIDPMDVGRFVSDDQLLTRFDARSSLWFPVRPRAILAAGERLVVLPTYRPQIALASGVQVTFAGESSVQMEEPLHPGGSRMSVEYGRFLVVTLGNAGAQLELDLRGLQGLITLEDSDTVVAIDVRHYLPPGSDAEKDERVLVIEMSAANGNIRWEEAGQDPIDIPVNHVLSYVAGKDRELSGPFQSPEWIDATSLTQIDRFTSPVLQRELDLDKPVHVRLQELMSDRRAEVRALAARCLAQLGEFEPLVRELGNAQQKSFWASEVDVLRQSLSRGSDAAGQIRQSLDSLHPKDAETLFRLLGGFNPEQLEASAAKELVEFLDSPEMAVRVLASDTLRQITGAQLLYRPEKPPAENRASIIRWSERQKEGSIAYKTPPSPLPERKPLAAEPAETKPATAKSKEE